MQFLQAYEHSSGQRIHKHKSGFILPPKAPSHRAASIHECTGFMLASCPIKDFGVPLYYGRTKAAYFISTLSWIRCVPELQGGKLDFYHFEAALLLFNMFCHHTRFIFWLARPPQIRY